MSQEIHNQVWTETIGAKKSLWRSQFKSLWEYRDLIFLLTKRDIIAFYKQTILGPLWFFIQPALTTAMFMLVFGRIAKIPIEDAPAPLFYLSGIIVWNYFAECLNKTSLVFKDNAPIFGKVYFPRLVMPVSIVISNLVRFFIQLLLLFFLCFYYLTNGYSQLSIWIILILPFVIFMMAVLGLGIGMIFSALTTKYRDLVFLLGFGIQLLMYITPVIYPLGKVSSNLSFFLKLNPLSSLIELFRFSFIGEGTFSFSSITYSIISAILLFVIGLLLFNKVEKDFMDTV